MINSLQVIGVIPARGGSKSVPFKNLQLLGGRPLLSWPIETALATPEIDRVFVSTDNEEIAIAGREFGAEIHERPAALATDTAQVNDTIRHLYLQLLSADIPADIFVLLEATSPLRTPELVSRCIQRLVGENLDSIATFHQADIHPERVWCIEDEQPRPFIDGAIPWQPRQKFSSAYQLNGAAYVFRPDQLPPDDPSLLFGRMGAEVIPAGDVIDIDDYKDFIVANAILESRNCS